MKLVAEDKDFSNTLFQVKNFPKVVDEYEKLRIKYNNLVDDNMIWYDHLKSNRISKKFWTNFLFTMIYIIFVVVVNFVYFYVLTEGFHVQSFQYPVLTILLAFFYNILMTFLVLYKLRN